MKIKSFGKKMLQWQSAKVGQETISHDQRLKRIVKRKLDERSVGTKNNHNQSNGCENMH